MKRWMTALVAVMMLTVTTSALAENAPEQKLDDATSVLQQFVNIPENKIPSALLRQAYGIAVIPSVFKIGFIGGIQRGKGVLSVRTADGKWSNPTFITLTGGSVGFQAGVSSTDIILVFKSRRSVDRIADGQFSLGGDASVAAGPVGRSVAASTNLDFNAEVYSYSRSRGLFAGVSVQGARIGIDKDANWLFYNQAGIKASTILQTSNDSSLPKAGQSFVYTLQRYMPASSDQFNYGSNTNGQQDSQAPTGKTPSQSANQPQGDGQTHPYDSNGGGVTVKQNSGSPAGSTPSGYQGAGSGNYNQPATQSGNQGSNQTNGQSSGSANTQQSGGRYNGGDYNNPNPNTGANSSSSSD
ncbi:MAG: YSC84-related protein [Salinisphaera sp.]|jgi:lipid-binding SYLF domain-containing protein|nr:YSC84-related protein [Salinisphaera sp.]